MLSIPLHMTHKLHPLNRSFMEPSKWAYSEACSLWMRKNPGLRINEYIAELACTAYTKVCRLEFAQKGFSSTSIHPINSIVFSDWDFLPSKITDVENPSVSQETGVPDANKRRLQCRKQKAQRSEILTSIPFKEMLQAKHYDKVEKETRKCFKCKKPLKT
ncbi:hypothetical protein PR048_011168 [Dryococelus australis]|uniref:DDE-1 domain-containing protein n=1 Tax=Dryococelus australis TaxID=614101 RepID=A0ABQ9HKW0_9NEOP|nr:hypothetical protein PR048_011168 [Dryococelus australis]